MATRDPQFGPEVQEYVERAVEMYAAAENVDLIFLVLDDKLSSPRVLSDIQRMLADHMTINEKPDRLLVVLPAGTELYGVARLEHLPELT